MGKLKTSLAGLATLIENVQKGGVDVVDSLKSDATNVQKHLERMNGGYELKTEEGKFANDMKLDKLGGDMKKATFEGGALPPRSCSGARIRARAGHATCRCGAGRRSISTRNAAKGARANRMIVSRSIPRCSVTPRRYRFPNPSACITAVIPILFQLCPRPTPRLQVNLLASFQSFLCGLRASVANPSSP